MKKSISFVCVFCTFMSFLVVCSAAYGAGIRQKTVQASGTGPSRDAAVKNALIEALGQVTGVYVEAEQLNQAMTVSVSADRKEDGAATATQGNILVDRQKNDVAAKVRGHIQSYSVVSEQPSAVNPGYVDVTVSAVINYYEAEKAVQRKRIASVPFRALNSANPYEKQFIEELNQGVVSFLTQTRNFAVLDREYLSEKYQEFDLLLGDDVKPEEKARIGNTVGTDYLLVGSVTAFQAKAKTEKVPYINEEVLMVRGKASVSWRLINAPTGMVMASGVHDEVFKEQIGSDTDFDWIAKLARPAGEKIGAKISDIIYPMLVAANNDGVLTIARGGDSVKIGQQYNLVQYGNIIKDPYTNEAIARDEIVIGKVEIINVTPKLSHAKILQCDKEIGAVNSRQYILRPVPEQENAAKKVKKQVKTMQPNW